jgi:toxin ParE1/3/4
LKITIADAARQDIEDILLWSYESFGELACQRYELLIVQAISDLSNDPETPGSRPRPELGLEVRTYHISLSKERVRSAVGRVRRPRHFLVYRFRPDSHLEIARVLHDSMDLERQEI